MFKLTPPPVYSHSDESDSDVDDYIEDEEGRNRIHQLDELIRTLGKNFDIIKPNCYIDAVLSVPNVRILKSNDHIISLQTFIRNKYCFIVKDFFIIQFLTNIFFIL